MRSFFVGICIGLANLVPGLSGGTMAVLLGVYEKLIADLNGLIADSGKRISHFQALLPVGAGVGLSILGFSQLMGILMSDYAQLTLCFFMGLIFGGLFLPLSMRSHSKWKGAEILALCLGVVMIIIPLFFSSNLHVYELPETMGISQYLLLFFAGIVAAGSMILPGLSGSFILLFMGVYFMIIDAVSRLIFPVILTVGVGALLGVFVVSQLIARLFERYRDMTLCFITGLMAGSLFGLWPGMSSPEHGVGMVVSAFTGAVVAIALSRKALAGE